MNVFTYKWKLIFFMSITQRQVLAQNKMDEKYLWQHLNTISLSFLLSFFFFLSFFPFFLSFFLLSFSLNLANGFAPKYSLYLFFEKWFFAYHFRISVWSSMEKYFKEKLEAAFLSGLAGDNQGYILFKILPTPRLGKYGKKSDEGKTKKRRKRRERGRENGGNWWKHGKRTGFLIFLPQTPSNFHIFSPKGHNYGVKNMKVCWNTLKNLWGKKDLWRGGGE